MRYFAKRIIFLGFLAGLLYGICSCDSTADAVDSGTATDEAGQTVSDFFRSVHAAGFSRVYICAHRANTWSGQQDRTCPENSVPAVLRCIEEGLDMVEIDVRETSDGQLVCCHDGTIDRVTTGTGKVSEMTYVEICRYDMTMEDGTVVPGVKIPLLDEVLAACRGRIWVNLDLGKTTIAPSRVTGAVEAAGMSGSVTFYTGSDMDLAKTYCRLGGGALSPHVSVSSAAATGDLAGLGAEPLFQISTSRYYDGTSGSTALSSAIRERGYCVFSNLLDYDAEVQRGKTDALEKFVEAKIDFLQTDYGDSPHVQNFLQSRGLRQ